MTRPIDVYEGLSPSGSDRMIQAIELAMSQAAAATAAAAKEAEGEEEAGDGIESGVVSTIPEFPELIGIDPEVYRQINAALASGIRHLMFYGPPGTGKTTLAQLVAGIVSDEWKLITGSSDWTSQDIIGGYQPLAGGSIVFLPGVLMEHFDKPIIFDELNRCDIDKVIGPLFTVLSGQSTTLPYLTDPADVKSPRIEILPSGQPNLPQSYAPSPKWRLFATINSIDKASLYQMSYALTRRFAWIYLDAPEDPKAFLREYVSRETGVAVADGPNPLGEIWEAVNLIRPVGPAPILDILRSIRAGHPLHDFFTSVPTPPEADPYLDGFYTFLLPMLDGVLREQATTLGESLVASLNLGSNPRAERLKARILRLSL